jgi:hypothetical protein
LRITGKKKEKLPPQAVKGRQKKSSGTLNHYVYHKTSPAARGKEKLWGCCALQVENKVAPVPHVVKKKERKIIYFPKHSVSTLGQY